MARIAGINIPPNKIISIGLTYIHGIGLHSSKKICDQLTIPQDVRVNNLTEDQVLKITEYINKNHKVEGDLRREISLNIKRLVDLVTYRGTRHKKKLPTRGQRTHSNARTRKGKAVAIAGKKLTPLKKQNFMNKKIEEKKEVKTPKTEPTKVVKSSAKTSSFKKKKKIKRNITSGVAYVYSTFNNTIIAIADQSGNVIAWSSAGAKGFKGSRKSTPYAAQVAADDAAGKAYEQGLRVLTVEVKGPGSGRETALRAFQSKGFKITSIKDTTPMPHNGTRPPKRRRV